MGEVAVINYEGSEITMSLIKWGILRRAMTSIGMMLSRFFGGAPPKFVPAYELALYGGSPSTVFREQPYIVFYFANRQIAEMKFEELKQELQTVGLLSAISASLKKIVNDREPDKINYMLSPKYYRDESHWISPSS